MSYFPSSILSPIDTSQIIQPQAWYDFSDTSNLFQNSDGTGGNPANGDPIGKCNDKTGNGNHITQATATARPTWTSGLLNGYGGARFDGTNDYLQSAIIASWIRPQMVFMVFKQITSVNNNRIIDGYNFNTGGVYQDGTKEVTMYAGNYGSVSQGLILGQFDIAIFSFLSSGTVCTIGHGNTSFVGTAQTSDMTGITIATVGIGLTGFFGNIDVMEIVVYNAIVPVLDRQRIMNYFSVKYKI